MAAVKYLGVLAGIAVTGMVVYSWVIKPPVGPPEVRARVQDFKFEVR